RFSGRFSLRESSEKSGQLTRYYLRTPACARPRVEILSRDPPFFANPRWCVADRLQRPTPPRCILPPLFIAGRGHAEIPGRNGRADCAGKPGDRGRHAAATL